jgi:hypothetical protein
MPKLLVFAPCEKVIIDQQNNPTLISILQQWSVPPSQEPPPENVIGVGLYRWVIFALWAQLEGDMNREFVQVCELKNPAGQVIMTATIAFRMTALTHRNIIGVGGLPLTPGDYELAVYLSEAGAEKERDLRGTFPLIARPAASP